MKQILCDRCHTVMCKKLYFKLEQSNWWSNVPNKKFHLCERCYGEFVSKFIRGYKETENEQTN